MNKITEEHRKQANAVLTVVKNMTITGKIPDRHLMLYCQCQAVLSLCDYIDNNLPEPEEK